LGKRLSIDTGGPGYYVFGCRALGIIATQGKVFFAYTFSAGHFVQYEIAPETDAAKNGNKKGG